MRDLPTNVFPVLVACMPKSGSTFLSTLLASVPGFRRESVVPSYKRREQEIDETELRDALARTQTLRIAFDRGMLTETQRPRGFVFQNHLRHSHETQQLIDRYRITPIVLVRNVFDVVISLRDHIRNESVMTPVAYVDDAMRRWDDDRLQDFLVDMAVPWYVHFYVSWAKAGTGHLVTYEALVADPAQVLNACLTAGRLPRNPALIATAIDATQRASTRRNVGQTGRGAMLSQGQRDRIRRYCDYYPDVDFTPLGMVAADVATTGG